MPLSALALMQSPIRPNTGIRTPTNESELKTNFPAQLTGKTLTVSTLKGTKKTYSLNKDFGKHKRVQKLQQTHPGQEILFIDDSLTNISQTQGLNLTSTFHYTGPNCLNQETIQQLSTNSQNKVLAIDFDLTITKTNTFPTFRQETNADYTTFTANFNQDTLCLLANWQGNIIIITNHNNHSFIVNQIYKAIQHAYNTTQQIPKNHPPNNDTKQLNRKLF